MLYRAISSLLDSWGIAYRSPGLDQLDLTKSDTIDGELRSPCRLVINCAAYTDVDAAEKNEALAANINGNGVGYLARACKARGIFLVHFSTDYVFSGAAPSRTRPGTRDPIGAYGRTKALGERLIEEAGGDRLIIRTSWLYAPWARNFVRTIAAHVRQNRPLKIVNDQTGRPTSAEHLALDHRPDREGRAGHLPRDRRRPVYMVRVCRGDRPANRSASSDHAHHHGRTGPARAAPGVQRPRSGRNRATPGCHARLESQP